MLAATELSIENCLEAAPWSMMIGNLGIDSESKREDFWVNIIYLKALLEESTTKKRNIKKFSKKIKE